MDFESLKTSMILSGEQKPTGRLLTFDPLIPKRISKESMLSVIKESNLDNYIKEELSKKIINYPAATMEHFYKNILTHISDIQKNRQL